MKQEEGAIELGAVIILLFLSAALVGSALFSQVSMIYFRKNSFEQEEKSGADMLLKEIVSSFQQLAEYDYDCPDNPLLSNLRGSYAAYGLDFQDISSGYHLDFLTDADLQDERLKSYLFLNGDASDFIVYRNSHGLSTDKTAWRTFVKNDAWEACVSYGWVNKSQIGSFAFSVISASHKTSDLSLLFPLVNEIPMMNVNMVSPDIVTPLIMRSSFKINKPEEKAENLKNKLGQGPVILSDLSSYLGISTDHALFAYLGTKTAFWKIIFCYRPGMFVEAVVAAIPRKDGGIQEITGYRLIDRIIKYEP